MKKYVVVTAIGTILLNLATVLLEAEMKFPCISFAITVQHHNVPRLRKGMRL